MKKLNIILILLFIGFLGCDINFKSVPLIKTEQFFKNPQSTFYQISPNGKYISYLASVNGKMNIFIKERETEKEYKLTSNNESEIRNYFWANDSLIVYLLDVLGNENNIIFTININNKQSKKLVGESKSNFYIINKVLDKDNNLLVASNKRTASLFDVYKLNIYNGKITEVLKNNGKMTWFIADSNNVVKIVTSTDGVNSVIYYRPKENNQFVKILSTVYEDDFRPLCFTKDGNEIYALSNINRDKIALVKYNLEKQKETEVVYLNNNVDVDEPIFASYKNKLVGITYIDYKKEAIYLDKRFREVNNKIKEKLKGSSFIIESNDKNENIFIVKAYSDKNLGTYYLYEAKDEKLKELSKVNKELKEEDLAETKPISYISRDGLRINGYLSLPPNTKPKNLPVVVMPHGGPWLRDAWGYNSNVQFLCNRGYAVLQVNYRGSKGYGKKFMLAGFKEWGGKMQDDIADGTKWLIEQNIANKDKIGIYGFSFGGYSALMNAIKYPELYKCAASYSGVIDLRNLLEKIPPTWQPFREMMYEMVGHPIKDSVMLKNTSPFEMYNKLKVSILVAQGANDPKIDIKQTDEFIKKLKKVNKDVTYIRYENEGHGFVNEKNRIEFYKGLERFLSKSLGGKTE